jgi:uncharacterized protein involved in exopolysaccharide biosynthesis
MQTSTKTTGTVVLTAPNSQNTFVPNWDESAKGDKVLARLRLLWMRRHFLWRCTVIGLVASIAIAFLIPASYTTTAELMPPDQQTGAGLAMVAALAGGSGGNLTSIAGDLLGVKTSGALFIAVMHSRTVQDRIIARFNLKSEYWVRTQEAGRRRLEKNTGIFEDRRSGVITLTVDDHDPKRAAGIAGAYIDELNVLMAQLNTSSAHRERVFLEGRLQTIAGELEAAEKDFSEFASKNGTIDITAQGRAMLEGAASLQGELIAAESELEGLRQIYADSNVRVRSIRARIDELRAQLSKLGGKYDASGDPSRGASSSGDSYPTLRQLPILGVPYADKYRQLKVEEAVYETLTKEYELARVEEAKEIPSVKVLDTPEVPERKSFPPRTLIILAGAIFAIVLGATWVLGSERWKGLDRGTPGMIFVNDVLGTLRSDLASRLSRIYSDGVRSNGSNDSGAGGPNAPEA